MAKMGGYGLVAAVVVCAAFAPGCYVRAHAGPPVATTSAEADYQPAYYDGYVVYYDNDRPFYYVNGVVTWVPQSSPHYQGLVSHYHAYGNGQGYARWNAQHGQQFRNTRPQPPGYHSYQGYDNRLGPENHRELHR